MDFMPLIYPTELYLTLLAEWCPNFKLHHTHGEWCLHPDANDPMSYQHEDLSICINSALDEVAEKQRQASMN